MIVAAIACFRETQRELPDSLFGFWSSVACFIFYVACGVWYWFRIRSGTWQRFWIQIIEKLG